MYLWGTWIGIYHIKQKSPDFSVETSPLFISAIIKRWFWPFGLHTRSLTNRFVCNFLSSSAGFNLCSCFFRLTLVFHFRFRPSLGLPVHGSSPLPFRFLTSAVSAFFRPPQFWILTTQPLLFLSAFLPVSPHSGFSGAPSPLSLPWLSPFSPSRFPVTSFPALVLGFLLVSFRPSLIRSRSCSSGAYLMLSLSVFPLPFRFLSSASRPVPATQPLFLPFRFPPGFASQWLPRCALSAFASWAFPVLSVPVSRDFLPGSRTRHSAIPFSARCLASQWLPQRLSLFPFGPRPRPHGFRFRFRLLGFGTLSFDVSRRPRGCLTAADLRILLRHPQNVNTFFKCFN